MSSSVETDVTHSSWIPAHHRLSLKEPTSRSRITPASESKRTHLTVTSYTSIYLCVIALEQIELIARRSLHTRQLQIQAFPPKQIPIHWLEAIATSMAREDPPRIRPRPSGHDDYTAAVKDRCILPRNVGSKPAAINNALSITKSDSAEPVHTQIIIIISRTHTVYECRLGRWAAPIISNCVKSIRTLFFSKHGMTDTLTPSKSIV